MTAVPGPGRDAREGGAGVDGLLRSAARRWPDRPAVLTGEHRVSYAELDRSVDMGARRLAAAGAGDRVVVALPTGLELILALFAVSRAGLVAVPVPPGSADGVAAAVGATTEIGPAPETPAGASTVTRIEPAEVRSWLRDESVPAAPENPGGEQLAMLVRAAWSPHPVMLSHRAVRAAVDAFHAAPRWQLRPEDRVLLVLALHHPSGWVGAYLPSVRAGAAAVVPVLPADPGGWIDAVLATVRQQRVTVVPAAPGLYRRLRDAGGVDRALASVRLMTSSAAPLEPADFAAVRSHTGQPVWEGYGISESAAVVTSALMTDTARPGSVGRPLPGIEVRILSDEQADIDGARPEAPADPAAADREDPGAERAGTGPAEPGATVDVGDVGEVGGVGRIAIRGDTLFSGYWPDGAGAPGPGGWFISTDLGYLDDAGELHLVDRSSEMLRVAGFPVYPREIENVLAGHPYVRDVAVIGVPGRAGEVVTAVLVAQRGTRPTPADLDEFVAGALPVFKRPVRYRLVDRLPRNEVGRVNRDAVRAEYLAAADADPSRTLRLAAALPDETRSQGTPSEGTKSEGKSDGQPDGYDRTQAGPDRSRNASGPPPGRRRAAEPDEELF